MEILAAQTGQTADEKLRADKNTSNTFEKVKPQDGSADASRSSASPKHFIDVFYGTAKTLDGEVSVTSSSSGAFCLFPPCPAGSHTVKRIVHFQPSAVYGIRVGKWFENYPYFGFAGDLSYLEANAPGVRIWYAPLSIILMGRYPLCKTESVPEGRLRLYGGAMLSTVIGDMEVDFTPDASSKISGAAGRFIGGVGGLLGVAWHFPSFALFSEYRFMKIGLDFEEKGLFGGSTSASADLESRQLVFGASYKY